MSETLGGGFDPDDLAILVAVRLDQCGLKPRISLKRVADDNGGADVVVAFEVYDVGRLLASFPCHPVHLPLSYEAMLAKSTEVILARARQIRRERGEA